ncbi:WD domain, G-beta repeat containing protein, putative [Babesia caballi]|uniref:WD domain, G-beta repeat containing protein, putative n=1 Tax=Babesia caballi TaxID=5871 RepID=A0AAV4M5H5_BABCB|nr:WD domain, G-beta repeat containing protein, putative [Babesia caballi]
MDAKRASRGPGSPRARSSDASAPSADHAPSALGLRGERALLAGGYLVGERPALLGRDRVLAVVNNQKCTLYECKQGEKIGDCGAHDDMIVSCDSFSYNDTVDLLFTASNDGILKIFAAVAQESGHEDRVLLGTFRVADGGLLCVKAAKSSGALICVYSSGNADAETSVECLTLDYAALLESDIDFDPNEVIPVRTNGAASGGHGHHQCASPANQGEVQGTDKGEGADGEASDVNLANGIVHKGNVGEARKRGITSVTEGKAKASEKGADALEGTGEAECTADLRERFVKQLQSVCTLPSRVDVFAADAELEAVAFAVGKTAMILNIRTKRIVFFECFASISCLAFNDARRFAVGDSRGRITIYSIDPATEAHATDNLVMTCDMPSGMFELSAPRFKKILLAFHSSSAVTRDRLGEHAHLARARRQLRDVQLRRHDAALGGRGGRAGGVAPQHGRQEVRDADRLGDIPHPLPAGARVVHFVLRGERDFVRGPVRAVHPEPDIGRGRAAERGDEGEQGRESGGAAARLDPGGERRGERGHKPGERLVDGGGLSHRAADRALADEAAGLYLAGRQGQAAGGRRERGAVLAVQQAADIQLHAGQGGGVAAAEEREHSESPGRRLRAGLGARDALHQRRRQGGGDGAVAQRAGDAGGRGAGGAAGAPAGVRARGAAQQPEGAAEVLGEERGWSRGRARARELRGADQGLQPAQPPHDVHLPAGRRLLLPDDLAGLGVQAVAGDPQAGGEERQRLFHLQDDGDRGPGPAGGPGRRPQLHVDLRGRGDVQEPAVLRELADGLARPAGDIARHRGDLLEDVGQLQRRRAGGRGAAGGRLGARAGRGGPAGAGRAPPAAVPVPRPAAADTLLQAVPALRAGRDGGDDALGVPAGGGPGGRPRRLQRAAAQPAAGGDEHDCGFTLRLLGRAGDVLAGARARAGAGGGAVLRGPARGVARGAQHVPRAGAPGPRRLAAPRREGRRGDPGVREQRAHVDAGAADVQLQPRDGAHHLGPPPPRAAAGTGAATGGARGGPCGRVGAGEAQEAAAVAAAQGRLRGGPAVVASGVAALDGRGAAQAGEAELGGAALQVDRVAPPRAPPDAEERARRPGRRGVPDLRAAAAERGAEPAGAPGHGAPSPAALRHALAALTDVTIVLLVVEFLA